MSARRDVSFFVDVLGNAQAGATVSVTINGSGQTVYRHGEYFQANRPVSNANGPTYEDATVAATAGGNTDTAAAYVLVPPANQTFLYDLAREISFAGFSPPGLGSLAHAPGRLASRTAISRGEDGNLTNDLVWRYTWDAENRLIAMDCLVTGPTAQHLVFEYDWQGRRIRKTVYDQAVGGSIIADTKCLYDGWNLTAELSPQSSVLRSGRIISSRHTRISRKDTWTGKPSSKRRSRGR